MPNWVYNGLTAQGPHESITKLKEQMNQPFTRVHDNWDTESQSYKKKLTTYPNPVFAFWNIIKPTDMEAYETPMNREPITDTKKLMEKIHNDSVNGMDWYNWNLRNWGTKWDVAVSSEDKHPDTYMEETEDRKSVV